MTDLPAPHARSKHVKSRPTAHPTLPQALVDSNQLELALLNLATNARDAMADGGKVTIEARQRLRR